MAHPIPVTLMTGAPATALGRLFTCLLNSTSRYPVALISDAGGVRAAVTLTICFGGVGRTSAGPDCLSALRRLANVRYETSRLVLHTSSMTSTNVAQLLASNADISDAYVLDETVAVLDLTSVPAPDLGQCVANALIEQVDTVLLTSTRAVSAKRITMTIDHVRRRNSRARILNAVNNDAALASLFHLGPVLSSA